MEFYGKGSEMKVLMAAWCEAIMRHIEFRQQMDPMTGDFTQADPERIFACCAGVSGVCAEAGARSCELRCSRAVVIPGREERLW